MNFRIPLLLMFLLTVSGYSLEVTVEGDSSSAPIYTLDGTGTSDMDVDGTVHVHQSFTYWECKNVSVNWKSATSFKEPPLGVTERGEA